MMAATQHRTSGPAHRGQSRFFACPRAQRIAPRFRHSRPAKRTAGRKTAPGIFFAPAPKTHPEIASQTLGTHQESATYVFVFVPGCAVAPNSAADAPNSAPLTINVSPYPASYNVNNQGTLTIYYSTSTNSTPVDGAPGGVTSAALSMTFTPVGSQSPTDFTWQQIVTNDPSNNQQSPYNGGGPVPYVDSPTNGSYEGNFPNGKYNNNTPIYSNGSLNYYDNPANPIGFPVNYTTNLNNKGTGTTLVQVIWVLPSGR
jgi:hypothetical protein